MSRTHQDEPIEQELDKIRRGNPLALYITFLNASATVCFDPQQKEFFVPTQEGRRRKITVGVLRRAISLFLEENKGQPKEEG